MCSVQPRRCAKATRPTTAQEALMTDSLRINAVWLHLWQGLLAGLWIGGVF